jgi:hypothetical protein
MTFAGLLAGGEKRRLVAGVTVTQGGPLMSRSKTSPLCSVLIAASLATACGDDGGGGGGASGNSGGSGGSGGAGATGAGTDGGFGGSAGGGSAPLTCMLNPQCPSMDLATCTCEGCEASCTDEFGSIISDCVCAVCAAFGHCSAAGCFDNGDCDPLFEGCACADCAGHPLCQ